MAATRTIRAGDCVSSVAAEEGVDPEKLWNDPDNDALREARDPNVLAPGDVLALPPKEPARFELPTGRRYTFTVRSPRVRLRVRLLRGTTAMADEPFVLAVDGETISAMTNGEGLLDVYVPARAKRADLTLPDLRLAYALDLGHLAPASTWAGVAQRLYALGIAELRPRDKPTAALRAALASFQAEVDLPDTGELDDPTVEALEREFGA